MQRKRIIGVCVSAGTFVLAILLGFGAAPNHIYGAGRLLSDAELTATFGDGTCPCKKEYQCTAGFTAALPGGVMGCGYCSKANTAYKRCCNLGDNTQCEYDTKEPCSESDFMVGPMSGSVGNCNSCTPGTVAKMGKCSLRTATDASKACP